MYRNIICKTIPRTVQEPFKTLLSLRGGQKSPFTDFIPRRRRLRQPDLLGLQSAFATSHLCVFKWVLCIHNLFSFTSKFVHIRLLLMQRDSTQLKQRCKSSFIVVSCCVGTLRRNAVVWTRLKTVRISDNDVHLPDMFNAQFTLPDATRQNGFVASPRAVWIGYKIWDQQRQRTTRL